MRLNTEPSKMFNGTWWWFMNDERTKILDKYLRYIFQRDGMKYYEVVRFGDRITPIKEVISGPYPTLKSAAAALRIIITTQP